MEASGNLLKMEALNEAEVQYTLQLGDSHIHLNPIIGKAIRISYQNKINCIHCGKDTKKSFSQGYCYKCFISLPQTDEGVLHPEKCMAHLGISRDMEWSKAHCLIDHFVYLANTGHVKVGVTRHTQIPTRWIDQGATQAIVLARTPYRNLAGRIEVDLKKHISDKTNWRDMLKGNNAYNANLILEKAQLAELLHKDYKPYLTDDNTVTTLYYPIKQYPSKIVSIDLEKTNAAEGILVGIKGQYLIFEDGKVLNIRKHNGYMVKIEVDS